MFLYNYQQIFNIVFLRLVYLELYFHVDISYDCVVHHASQNVCLEV
jgi:hypothetical protein